jgi:hypothetical protein
VRLPSTFAGAFVAAAFAGTRAEPPAEFWAVPPGAVAFWACDPGTLERTRPDRNLEVIEAAIAQGLPATVDSPQSFLLQLITDKDAIGRSPYRVALLSFAATCQAPIKGRVQPALLTELHCVLAIEHLVDDTRLLARLREGRTGNGWTESPAELPGGHAGHSLGLQGQAPVLQWCRDGDAVFVGVGPDSLRQWWSLPHGQADDFASRHEPAPQGRAAFVAWANLNALRQSAPELFAYGRLNLLLQPWQLSNSRSLYIAGRLLRAEPHRVPLLMIAAAWSPRSEAADSIHSAQLTESEWPADLPVPRSDMEAYAVVFRTDWRAIFNSALGTATALSKSPTDAQARSVRWIADHISDVRQLLAAGDDHLPLLAHSPNVGPTRTRIVIRVRPENRDEVFHSAKSLLDDLARGEFVRRDPQIAGYRVSSTSPWSDLRVRANLTGDPLTVYWEETPRELNPP